MSDRIYYYAIEMMIQYRLVLSHTFLPSTALYDQLPGIYINHTLCVIACSKASLCSSVVLVSGEVIKLTMS